MNVRRYVALAVLLFAVGTVVYLSSHPARSQLPHPKGEA
jgi:hypothetical protein